MARARKILAQDIATQDPNVIGLDGENRLPNVIMGLIGVFIFFYIASIGWKAGK